MAYIPQLTPTYPTNLNTDDIYYSWNIFYNTPNPNRSWAQNFGLPNCTAYAYGRFWSLAHPQSSTDNRPTFANLNGKDWFGYTTDGYERGQTPKLGAVICYDDAAGSPFYGGHVAIVEEIFPDGTIRTSNSGYTENESERDQWFFWTELIPADFSRQYFVFQGFIYNPFAESGGKLPIWLLRRQKHAHRCSKFAGTIRHGKFI